MPVYQAVLPSRLLVHVTTGFSGLCISNPALMYEHAAEHMSPRTLAYIDLLLALEAQMLVCYVANTSHAFNPDI